MLARSQDLRDLAVHLPRAGRSDQDAFGELTQRCRTHGKAAALKLRWTRLPVFGMVRVLRAWVRGLFPSAGCGGENCLVKARGLGNDLTERACVVRDLRVSGRP